MPTLGATLTSVVLLLLLGTALVSGSFRILPRFRAVDGSLRLFSCLLGGLAATVIAASLSFTTGNSVSVVLLGGTALAALAAATQPISPNVQRPAAPTAWPWVVGASIALCLWFGLHNTHVGEFQWQVPFRDTAHYAQVAAALAETGIETPLGAESRVPYRPLKPTPYHYFELWLSAVLARSWNSPTLPLVILTTPTLLALTLGVGFLALADAEGSKRSLRLWAVVALWLAPFLPGVALHTHLLREADVFTGWGSILGHAKLLPLYLCVVAALLFFDAGYQAAALTLVACCGVVNFTALPTSLVASAFALLAANKPQGRPARMAFMCPSVVLLGIVLFYTANAGGGGPWPHSRELVGSALDLTTLRTRVHIVAKTSIQLAAVYTPLLLLAGPRAVAQQVRRYGWFLGGSPHNWYRGMGRVGPLDKRGPVLRQQRRSILECLRVRGLFAREGQPTVAGDCRDSVLGSNALAGGRREVPGTPTVRRGVPQEPRPHPRRCRWLHGVAKLLAARLSPRAKSKGKRAGVPSLL